MVETLNIFLDLENVFRLGETQSFLKLGEWLECLLKLVITSYRLGEMSGGFGKTSFDQLLTWRNVWRVW